MMLDIKKKITNVKDKVDEKTTKNIIIPTAIKFYKQQRKLCRSRNDVKGVKLCDDVLDAIKKQDVNEITETQAILGGHLQFMKAQKGGRFGYFRR